MSDAPYPDRTNDRRVIPWLLVGLVVLFGGLYVAAYLATSDRVPRNTTIATVPVGGLTREAAQARLADRIEALAGRRLTLEANDSSTSLVPGDAGLHVDVVASLAQAGAGRSWKLSRMWDYLAGGRDYPAVVTVDDAALTKAVQAASTKLDQAPVDGAVTFSDGEAFPADPAEGSVVDQPAAARALRAAFLGDGLHVTLPTLTKDPAVTSRDVSVAMSRFANPAMSGPVTFTLGGRRVVVRPDQYDAMLSMVPRNGVLVPRVNAAKLVALVRPGLAKASRTAVDAGVRVVGNQAVVVPGKPGRTFDPHDVTTGFLTALRKHGAARVHAVRTIDQQPAVTAQKVSSWGISTPVAEFTVTAPQGPAAAANLRHAAALVDGTVLRPRTGALDLNALVGARVPANGFVDAATFVDGAQVDDDAGVGPLATALFNAAYRAGLRDDGHTPHATYLAHYPVGLDAGSDYRLADLRFTNTTPHGVLVQAWSDAPGRVHVRLWSTPTWDVSLSTSPRRNVVAPGVQHLSGVGCVARAGVPGFEVATTRTFRKHGVRAIDHRDVLRVRYIPLDAVTCS